MTDALVAVGRLLTIYVSLPMVVLILLAGVLSWSLARMGSRRGGFKAPDNPRKRAKKPTTTKPVRIITGYQPEETGKPIGTPPRANSSVMPPRSR